MNQLRRTPNLERVILGTTLVGITIGGAGILSPVAAEVPKLEPAAGRAPLPTLTTGPVMWKGVLRDSAGKPTAGRITVSVMIDMIKAATTPNAQLPVGRVDVDASGNFEIRVPWSDDFIPYLNEAGQLTFNTTAVTAGDELSLGINEMTFHDGRWVPAGVAAGVDFDPTSPGVQTSGRESTDLLSGITGATDDMTAAPTPSDGREDYPLGDDFFCNVLPAEGNYHPWYLEAEQRVAEAHIQATANFWTVGVGYENTRTTSSEVAMRVNFGPWGGGGGRQTMASTSSAVQEATLRNDHWADNPTAASNVLWPIVSSRPRVDYLCSRWSEIGSPTAPAPRRIETVAPGGFVRTAPRTGRNTTNHSFSVNHCNVVWPRGSLKFEDGRTANVKSAWEIGGAFKDVAVSMTGEFGSGGGTRTWLKWDNSSNENRLLCGNERTPLDGDPKIVATVKQENGFP